MTANNADQVVFDKVAEINASKESWNIRVKVVMLWKPTYINNPNMVASLDMILIDQEDGNNEIYPSATWQWREFQNIQLPSSVYPVSHEAVTSGGVVYFLLSNDTILRFDIYSEEHILIFTPSIINDFRPYASRLIKFHGKLGYFSVSGDNLWAIWVFIQNRWVKVDVSNYNEGAHEWWDYRNSTLYFFKGNTIEYVVPAHPSQQVFSIRSDFDKVTMPSRY
ncbi:unnamed protein product [Lactuca virosa]|uniref:F-box associated beta-propeller type 3 domain-containing protein n=1 Tax=Lactuca virosa TaxID=75947 RepID=A0AAU9MX29_9ASTR|nr:unnamed protein product [Lactuca virosa]